MQFSWPLRSGLKNSWTNNEFKNQIKRHDISLTIQRAKYALNCQRSQLMMTDRPDLSSDIRRPIFTGTYKMTSFIYIIYWGVARHKWANSTAYSEIFVNHITAYYIDRTAWYAQSARNTDYLKNNSFSANARNRVGSHCTIQ